MAIPSSEPDPPEATGGVTTRRRHLRVAVGPALTPSAGWIWPYWLERQLDPASPSFVPRGDAPVPVNTTHRDWTTVGNLDSWFRAIVDRRGLVTLERRTWSLDWWIGAEDRWHVPSREVSVRQRLLDGAPVVETAMRVPSGDAVHRVYAGRRSSQDGGGELVVVEVENRSKVPVALALGVRPCTPTGLGEIERIEVDDTVVRVDGEEALLLPKPPSRAALSTAAGGDAAGIVLAGDAGDGRPDPVHCPVGMAQGAFVVPLAHGTVLRVVLPGSGAVRRAGRRRLRSGGQPRGSRAAASVFPTALPAAADVARGWAAQARRGLRLELPDERLAEAVEANRRSLLLLHDRVDVDGRPRGGFRDAALLSDTLGLYGFHDEAARLLASHPDRQRLDGSFGDRREQAASGAALWALGRHWHLTRDRSFVEPMVGPIAKATHRIERARQGRGRPGAGLLPPGRAADGLGPVDRYYADGLWALAGFEAAAAMQAGVGQSEAAEDAKGFAAAFRDDLARAWDRDAERLGRELVPGGPERDLDPAMIGPPAAVWSTGLSGALADRALAGLEVIRAEFLAADGQAFYQSIGSVGLSPRLTLQLAGAELMTGDVRCVGRLGWVLDAATPTWTWPTALHPRLAGGCHGDGHDPVAGAELLRFVRTLLVGDRPDGPAMATLVPGRWLGQGWEVHDAPTDHGVLSYAVRWHGDRPALLWDLRRHEGDTGPVTLTAPGLDPGWSTTEVKGEALLSAIPPESAPQASFH